MIQDIDRSSIETIKQKIKEALKPVEEELGVRIQLGTSTFNADQLNTKITIIPLRDGNGPSTKHGVDFKRYARIYQLRPEDLGRKFRGPSNTIYELIGCAPKSHRFPLLGKRDDGKIFKFPVDSVVGKFI